MPEEMMDFSQKFDALAQDLSGTPADASTDADEEETEPTAAAEDTPDADGDEDSPAGEEDESEEQPDAAEDSADEDDDWSDEGQEGLAADLDEGPTFDADIYKALKDPKLVQRLKGHEKGFRKLHEEYGQLKTHLEQEQGKISQFEQQYLSDDAPIEAQAWLIEQMAKAKGYEIEEYVELITNGANDRFATKVEAEHESRLAKIERQLQERERAASERERQANEEAKIRASAPKMARTIMAELGWQVPTERIIEAVKKFPDMKPSDAVIAAYPKRYRDFVSGLSRNQAKAPTLPKGSKGTERKAIGPKASFDDAYEHFAQTIR